MLSIKKYYYLFFLCLMAFLFVSCSARTKDEIKKSGTDQQKAVNEQKKIEPESDKGEVSQGNGNVYPENSPQIVIDSPQFDVGDVFEGDDLLHSFIVKNTGGGILNIKNVKPG